MLLNRRLLALATLGICLLLAPISVDAFWNPNLALNRQWPDGAPTRAHGHEPATGLRHQLKSFECRAQPT